MNESSEVTEEDAIAIPEDLKNLVIPIRVKKMIEDAGLKASNCCIEALTNKVYRECTLAIERAKTANRKIVKGKDIE